MIHDKATQYTKSELRKLERAIRKAFSEAYDELYDKWKKCLDEAKEEEKPYIDAYIKAKNIGDKAEIKRAKQKLAQIQRKYTYYSDTYQKMRDRLAAQLAELDKTTYALANGKLNGIYAVNYNSLADALPTGYTYGLITPQTVRNLLIKEINLVKSTAWNAQLMNEQVLAGILQGESMDKIAERFETVFGMNEQSAIRNARTAVTYAQNQGRLDSYKEAQSKGIVLVKVWSTSIDGRERDSHREINGVEIAIDKKFPNGLQCPGDPNGIGAEIYNCRCAMGTRIIGFRREDGSIVKI